MRIFKLHPQYDAKGERLTAWVDDGAAMMDFPYDRMGSAADDWPTDLSFPIRESGSSVGDVLFNPDGLIFSDSVRRTFNPILRDTVEWLPLTVQKHGTYYMLHPLRSVDLGADSDGDINSVSRNVTFIRSYHFDSPSDLPECFMLNQPIGSAAREAGFCMRGVYVDQTVRDKMEQFTGVDFSLVFDSNR